jgi:RecA/RadA recombinase
MIDTDNYLSSGITLLNCGLTDNPFCAFKKGSYNLIAGESMAGKTWFAMQLFAEASHNEVFSDYKLIFDQPEDGALMDIGEHFGQDTEERIVPPFYLDDETHGASETLEQMYSLAKRAFKKGPCIEFVDSHDALSCKAESDKADKIDESVDNDTVITGIMSDGKAKVNSAMLRQLARPLKSHGSIFFMISQLRDNLGFGFEKKSRSGGKALRFYATTEIWFNAIKKLKKKVKGIDHEVGNLISIQVKKNRNSSQRPTIEIPLIHDYGFDDTTSCVEWLNKHHWRATKQINCPELVKYPVTMKELISYVEEKASRQEKLRILVGEVWNDIRNTLKPDRKKRYE